MSLHKDRASRLIQKAIPMLASNEENEVIQACRTIHQLTKNHLSMNLLYCFRDYASGEDENGKTIADWKAEAGRLRVENNRLK